MSENDDARRREENAERASTVQGTKAEESVDKRVRLGALAIFEIIRREGAEEMRRPYRSLAFSGIAAGIALSLSAAAAAMFHAALPEGPARTMLTPLAYSIGFLIVVFGRLQLFTENTIATILPIAIEFNLKNIWRTARLYIAVLIGNVFGAFLAALVFVYTPMLTDPVFTELVSYSSKIVGQDSVDIFWRAIPAGFMIAAMVWMMPSGKGAEFWIVIGIIYILVLAEFVHVIVGSHEAFVAALTGEQPWTQATLGFFFPALFGNMIGGTALFTVLAYAQIHDEVIQDDTEDRDTDRRVRRGPRQRGEKFPSDQNAP